MKKQNWIYQREDRVRNMVINMMKKKEKSDEEIKEFEKTVKHTEMPEEIRTGPRDKYLEWQKKREETRKKELEGLGIKGEDYMTRESLKKWIEDEKRTYMEVARDYIGESRDIVSMYAKEYGIESENSKKAKERIKAREEEKEKEKMEKAKETEEKIKKNK
jgi:hypothetical protein